jgi:hypothetical protein
MKKKYMLGAAALVLVAGALFGFSNLIDYGSVAVDEVSEAMRDQVPIPAKIKVMEKKVASLDSKIDGGKHIVAEQRASVGKHAEVVEEQVAARNEKWNEIVAMTDALDASDGEEFVSIGGNSVERTALENEIESRYEGLKRMDATLDHEKELLSRERQVLAANEKALGNLFAAKDKLELMIQDLKARQKLIEARQVEEMESIDGSPTEDVMALYGEIDEQLRVEEELLDMEDEEFGKIEIKVDGSDTKSVLDEIRNRKAKEASKDGDLINTLK